eukprot:CAMPEP_0172446642 /NCGR_PEP_ID=MMETSP1065-20121228/6200_1 /TAXON_ID=265537 /ORGANISM="Amphiprora paludosa, Strain CCMP125" /LENGTH=388 /DNA_ID=CAMNT_0013197813 /DNA_START=15 /DNA_END=1178 /DNA_ORIENTATION=-
METLSLQDEINSLEKQLIQVKRRLFPAAEQCAECSEPEYGIHQMTARQEFNTARSHCNPFEVLGERRGGIAGMFMNRAAVKLANIDALIGFELTRYDGQGPFVFVDLAGAPGGFSEYVIRRCQIEGTSAVMGYGMSLLGSNEYGEGTPWKLNSKIYAENSFLRQYRICEGADGTGDIFVWDNVESLLSVMMNDYSQYNNTNNGEFREEAKANLVLADGGFDAQRDSENQEAIAQKLIVCEVAAALAVLRKGGTMVVKMFGFQTEVVRAVLADLQNRFHDLIVLKPISSRPASAERYLVCREFDGLEESWNGPSWTSRMFLGEAFGLKLHNTTYFDSFDRDLLRLNLKSCFSILTYLENKHSGDSDEWDWNKRGSHALVVRPAAYKHGW